MAMSSKSGERFFLYFPWFILLTVVVCFGGKAIFDTADLPPITYLHHLHAVAMLSWFGLFAAQPTLIHLGRTALHRRLGRWSPLVVVGFMAFAIPISLLNWTRTGEVLIITANTVNLILFVTFYLLAIGWRLHAGTHKRLMTYATLSIMGPALGRLPEIFDQSPFLILPLLIGMQLTPLVYDLVTRRGVHPATLVGLSGFVLSTALILGLPGSPVWLGLLEQALGPGGTG